MICSCLFSCASGSRVGNLLKGRMLGAVEEGFVCVCKSFLNNPQNTLSWGLCFLFFLLGRSFFENLARRITESNKADDFKKDIFFIILYWCCSRTSKKLRKSTKNLHDMFVFYNLNGRYTVTQWRYNSERNIKS